MDVRTRHNSKLPTGASLWLEGCIQTQSEGMEKDIPYTWKPKESRGTYTYTRKKQTLSQRLKAKAKKQSHCIMKRNFNTMGGITFVNVYAPNIGTPKCIK